MSDAKLLVIIMPLQNLSNFVFVCGRRNIFRSRFQHMQCFRGKSPKLNSFTIAEHFNIATSGTTCKLTMDRKVHLGIPLGFQVFLQAAFHIKQNSKLDRVSCFKGLSLYQPTPSPPERKIIKLHDPTRSLERVFPLRHRISQQSEKRFTSLSLRTL